MYFVAFLADLDINLVITGVDNATGLKPADLRGPLLSQIIIGVKRLSRFYTKI